MSKAQTDIRTTSYDVVAARPFGYTGTIDEVIAQISAEPDHQAQNSSARAELLKYLGVTLELDVADYGGPSLDMDTLGELAYNASYGAPEPAEEPGKWSLGYAMKHFPESFYRAVGSSQAVADRLNNLSESQLRIYARARLSNGIDAALSIAEAFPYPAARS